MFPLSMFLVTQKAFKYFKLKDLLLFQAVYLYTLDRISASYYSSRVSGGRVVIS